MRSLADEVPFDIPDSWEWVRLIAICEYIQRGKSPKYSPIKKYPVVAQKCNQWSGFSIEKAQFIEPDSLSSYGPERLLQDNDLMWNSTGLGTLGRMAIYKTAGNPYELAVADSHVTVIRPLKQFVLPEYLYYYFANPTVQSVIEDQADGTTKQKELATATIKAYLTPIPPLKEQRRILAKLSEVLPVVNSYGAVYDETAAMQDAFPERLKKSILQEAVQGKLVLKPNGYRQFNTAYIEIPKKQGKSELAAAVALLLTCGDGEERAEVYGCAADRQQASIVFNVAADMVRMCPALSKRVKILDSQKRLIYQPTGSIYQVLSADVGNKHGFNTHGVVFDELHTQPNRKLFDVMTKGSGDARMQPLYFLITTAGNDTKSICYEIHQKAKDIIEGRKIDHTFYPVIYGAEESDDWTDPKVWKKANSSLGITVGIDKVKDACESAKQKPGPENSFRLLRLEDFMLFGMLILGTFCDTFILLKTI